MLMSGYTKLFQSILGSTIWREPDHVRLVWITMLAAADQFGRVEASVPGLAVFANVSLDLCQDALDRLSAPDTWSRNKTQNGKRIEDIEGGWRIINHGHYRNKLSADERREYNRVKQREYRQRTSANVNDVNEACAVSAQAEAEATTDTEAEEEKIKPSRASRSRPTFVAPPAFEAFWEQFPKKTGKGAALKAWEKIAPDVAILAKIAESLSWQVNQPQWLRDGGQFIPHPATWLNQRRWEDEPFHPEQSADDVDPHVEQLCEAAGIDKLNTIRWFSDTESICEDGSKRIKLIVPNETARDWIQRHYLEALTRVVVARGANGIDVVAD